MLWRRCSNVMATSWQRCSPTLSQRRRPTSPQLSFSTVPQRCDNVNHDVVTTLSQRRCASWVAGFCDYDIFSFTQFFHACHYIIYIIYTRNFKAFRFYGTRKPAFLNASLGESYTPHTFVLLVTFGGTSFYLIVYVTVLQMKLWKMLKKILAQLYTPERHHWYGDIKKHWRSSDVFIVNFGKIPHLIFHC